MFKFSIEDSTNPQLFLGGIDGLNFVGLLIKRSQCKGIWMNPKNIADNWVIYEAEGGEEQETAIMQLLEQHGVKCKKLAKMPLKNIAPISV
jgi:hypothetical protein